ncbi:MAG: hypothetical protein M3521_03560 [Acidobacteriota bacterium]|nr:hypothetical protein [Acidobacteriota bacterium]
MKDENTKYKQYLLGNLSAMEIEEIDLQLISDKSLEERLYWAESELAEDYLDNVLSPPEVALFEKNFLVSPTRETQLRQISLLRNYARNAATSRISQELCEKSSETFYGRLKRFFALNWQPASAVLTLIIFGLLVGTAIYYSAYESTPLEKEFAELNQKDLNNLSDYRNLTNVNLPFGAFRDSGSANKLLENVLTDAVLFRLALPFEANSRDRFKVEILMDKKNILSRSEMPFYSNLNGKELRLLMPSTVLKKGEYQIKVEKENSIESAVNYNFIVQ